MDWIGGWMIGWTGLMDDWMGGRGNQDADKKETKAKNKMNTGKDLKLCNS
jgi:hypothetical protein